MSKQEKRIRHIAEQSLLGNCQIWQDTSSTFSISQGWGSCFFIYSGNSTHLADAPCKWIHVLCFRFSFIVNWSEVTEALTLEQTQERKSLESAVVNPYLSKVLGYATLHDSSENTCNHSFKSFQKSKIRSIFTATSHHPEIWVVKE